MRCLIRLEGTELKDGPKFGSGGKVGTKVKFRGGGGVG